MSESIAFGDHPDVNWGNAAPEWAMLKPVPLPAVRRFTSDHGDSRPAQPAYAPCRCWRCRGVGVSSQEKAALDRLLARQLLLNMSWQEREEWIAEWALNPNHTETDLAVLRRWIAIEEGQRLPRPVYPERRAVRHKASRGMHEH